MQYSGYRGCRLDLRTPAEVAITTAINIVEHLGCDSRLTEVVTKLGEAQKLLADYVDGELREALSKEGWDGNGGKDKEG